MVAKNLLPDGALPLFGAAQAWCGPDAARSRAWIYELDREELAEIDRAVTACVERRTSRVAMSVAGFPLPRRRDAIVEGAASVAELAIDAF